MNTTISGSNLDQEPRTKAELLERVRRSRVALEDEIRGLTSGQLSTPGPEAGWAIKDHFAHLAEWEGMLMAILHGRPGYEGLRVGPATYQSADIDTMNAILFERNRARPADEVLAIARRSFEQVLETLEDLDDQDLAEPYTPSDPDETRRKIDEIADNTYRHYEKHRAEVRKTKDQI